jgi:extradiol dioxygenase family protein
MKPFHLSFAVPNLETAKEFYINILQCEIGRDMDHWIDILFFGHQITIHQESEQLIARPIDHFGPILEKEIWQNVYARCKSKNVEFILLPTIKNVGEDDESGKFIILDPAKNIIEFKFYNSFNTTVKH